MRLSQLINDIRFIGNTDDPEVNLDSKNFHFTRGAVQTSDMILIEELQDERDDLESSVEAMGREISDLECQIYELEDENDDLKERIKALEDSQ